MALLSKIKIFRINREVWVLVLSNCMWKIKRGRVESVTKGCIHVVCDDGVHHQFSPNSRQLNLTEAEAKALFNILNVN